MVKKKFHQERCTACIRAVVIDPYGRKIILYGKHAFNYSIYIEGITGNVVIETYKNGTIARKRFNELKKKLTNSEVIVRWNDELV